MKLKVLVTGKNRIIASDICEHLEHDRGYKVVSCPVTKTALFQETVRNLPNVIIICAGDENRDSVQVYDILRECSRMGSMDIIVVANDEERAFIMSMTRLERISFIARPVSLTALYKILEIAEENLEKDLVDANMAFETFVNPNTVETFPRKHILVVDDDPEQLMLIKEQLREFYEVTLVGSGELAFKALKKFKVDLILLDYMMPKMDGPEVLQMLREFPDYKDIPVVFLTGVSEREVVIQTLMNLKPQGYLLKPSKKSEIVAKIIDVLG